MIGERIDGRYKVKSYIGGGMAYVYHARDIILERDVAVKVLQPHHVNDDEFVRRFRLEAQAATSLVHPNVVDIYDVGEDHNLFYIVMEYVGGNTLKDKIVNNGALSFPETMNIFSELTAAIAYAHEQGIIHRDLKPQNILLDENGTVKVTDFGIARAASAATITHTNSVLGSVHYLSPEQARAGAVTVKTDIYALGVILYEMVTGLLPYNADSAVSIALKHLQDPFPNAKDLRADLPESINNMIRKATAKDPLQRYENVEEIYAETETALLPERINEEPIFVDNQDEEKTKPIPAIHTGAEMEDTRGSGVPEEEGENEAPDKKQKKWGIWKILGVALLPILGFFAAFTIIPELLSPDEVEVPDVVGLEEEEAIETMNASALEVETEFEFHNEVEEGEVYYQDPAAGRTMLENQTVTLSISEGQETMEMPDVIGLDVEQAEEELEVFSDIELVSEQTDEVASNLVVDQEPAADEEVIADETRVRLTYSETPEVTLQDLTGTSQEGVNNYLETNNLTGSFQSTYSDTVPEGDIISHDPAPYETISQGSEINFVVSDGPAPEEEEDDPVQTVEAVIPVEVSEQEDNESVYDIEIVYEDATTDEPAIFVEEEITTSTTYRVPLEVTPDTEGSYTLYVNGEEAQANSFSYEE
ncbi:serine/threonine-protein kinase [Geomicrobium halophilum]|uniref:Serine/threonine-protein kinase PrkC n=1 Tax=Geomicrobium halophilum TaxID=549000 RepID=A0A841PYP5_9BACL|nr:Stk1 family PASTA domain-containing Ser/Thr kinase [Geomicrobium halophilum]MBB6449345.1 serine/threonine-protein kinase [Geomicrobium halophilum]